jgi:hypothetical protein
MCDELFLNVVSGEMLTALAIINLGAIAPQPFKNGKTLACGAELLTQK